jgi:predicted CXXCH cytochrome family protein
MIFSPIRLLRLAVPTVLVAAAVAGCTETKTEFVEVPVPAPPFNPPPDAVNGFLGYFDVATQQTTCGNCHVSRQGQWESHAHSDAWNTLEASGHAQDFCRTCHTVSENGNLTDAPAGWNAVQTDVYHDVQCESCHGPGITHVQAPDAGTAPLASIQGDTLGPASCGTCHSGTHHGFFDDWSKSRHSQMNSYPQGRAECISCHTAQGALAAFGVNDNYIEKNAPVGQHEDITCAVCHDPHGSGITSSLRFPISVPIQEQNLCMKCHHKRAEPEQDLDPGSRFRGPHSPEGPLLLGEGAGWFPPNFTPLLDTIRGTHGSTANPGLCATCHLYSYTVTDQATGDFVVNVTGHRFLAIPCVDANGAPTDDQNCSYTPADRSFSGCTNGCHGDAIAAATALSTAETRLGTLEAQLDAQLTDPLVPPADLDPLSGIFTSAKGCQFNLELSQAKGSSVHNPFLMEQLLIACIQEMDRTYGPFPITVDLEYQLH